MGTIFKIFIESISQAFQQLWGSKLRTFLSLLGITIGIWCVIMVLSAVDSMEYSIRNSIQKLGDDVIYIDKFSWEEDPNANYWKWMRRPNPNYKDFKSLKENMKSAKLVSYSSFLVNKNIEYRSSNIEGAIVIIATQQYKDMFNIEFSKGRYFTDTEYRLGSNKVVLGHKIAEELFGNIDPIGKKVKLLGSKCYVIGVIEETGKGLFNPLPFDNSIIMSYELGKKVTDIKGNITRGASINVKAEEGIPMEQLKDEITGVLRSSRRIKPKSENNFALNSMSILTNALDSIFGVLKFVGFIIGACSMFVGMFSVANIMFVSVKERTNLIGIKKALGARRRIILLEFITESIILCLIGGMIGLFFVWLASYMVTMIFGFEVFLSTQNLIIGIITSTITGVISGIIPAFIAAFMDPVEAIRQ